MDAGDRKGDQEHHQQCAACEYFAHGLERCKGASSLCAACITHALRGSFGKEEAINSQDDSDDCADPEGVGHVFHLEWAIRSRLVQEPLADADADGDPADGAPDADFAKIAIAVG